MKHACSRILAWLLVLTMVFSMVPTVAFAEDSATSTTWTKTTLSEITASDTVAITMSKDDVTYVLPTTGAGGDGQPLADTATVSGSTLTTTGESTAYGWNISATEGGYFIKTGDQYLYITNTNDGVRIGETAAVWTLDEGGYLASAISAETTRYLGVYVKGLDWRCYKAYASGNISGQTLEFWKLGGSATTPTDPTDPDPTQPSEPDTVVAQLTTEVTNGSKVYIYNPKNAKVMTATASGNMLASTDGTVADDQLTVTDDMVELTVTVDDNGNYLFQAPDGTYLTAGETSNNLTFSAESNDYSLWTVEAAEGGFTVKNATATYNDNPLYLEYYKENFTTYTYTQWNTAPYVMQFFTTGTAGGFTSTLTAGDQVVIYNPTYSMGLSNVIVDTEKNQDLAGTALTLNGDDTLSGYTEADLWTVGVNEDGSYTFTSTNGQKLAVVNRTHVGFAEENTSWTLTLIDGKTDEFYVKGPIGTYLEWYATNNYWSAFYNPSEEMYAIRFYVVGGTVQPSNTVAAPKASPKAGTVDSGTEISFTCSTEGATIYYKVGEGEWTEYTAPIAITEDTTFTVKATKEGMEDSKEVTFAYTIYVPPVLGEHQAQLVTDASTLVSGDQILIVTADYDYAMGTTQKANNRDQAPVIKAYDKVSYDEYAQIITLESGVEENTFALYATNGDNTGYLYASADSGNILRTQEGKDTAASFTISIDENGLATIQSKLDKKASIIQYNTVGIFSCYSGTQKKVSIYKLLDNGEKPGLPENGDQVVIYNLSAKGVLSGMDGDIADVYSCSIGVADAYIAGGKAVCSNGAVVFTVQQNGDYFRFYNESFGYLCSTGTGNCTFYTKEASEDADWVVTEYNGGYRMGSRTAAYSGNMQYLQYYAESFTTWGMYAVTDRDVFTYHFYPCANEQLTDGVVNEPQAVFGNLAPAYAGQTYRLHFTVDALFGVKELHVYLGETELEVTLTGDRYTATIPAELIVGTSLTVTVTGLDNKDVAINSSVEIEVKDEPVISGLSPVANSQTKENKRPEISAVLTNVGENPTIAMTVNGEDVTPVYADGKVSYTPAEDMADGRVTVTLTVTRADGKSVSKSWSFIVGESNYTLYFGQLHSHTTYSDGSGSLESALEYIANLPEESNVDFVAFTDHSNYFDKSGEANPEGALYDMSLATEYSQQTWSAYKTAIANFNETHSGIIAIGGFEMTWSGGPGHMNTFNTPGIVSRNNTTLNSKTSDAGMKLYYSLLAQPEGADSLTQLNHPGTTFGNFSDFAYWDASYDEVVALVEVGNGEGQIGAGGYYPSYEQYTLALDKGWHVAPTNNQDNHKGKWGNANDARDVILAETFTEDGIYDAIRNRRVYATEDKNLEITYNVNDLPMGTIIESVPEQLSFDISIMDPDATDSITKVELIVNSGKVAYTWDDAAVLATGILTAELSPEYSYYYVRVTEADGDLAVTAPVWVGESLMLGVSSVDASTTTPVTGEEMTISTTVYNSEDSDALVKSITYTTNGSQVLAVDTTGYALAAGSTLTIDWPYTPDKAKLTTITATVVLELESKEYTFSASVELDVQDASSLTYIGIDASHANEYVAGYNKDLMNNFSTLANSSAIRTEVLTTSEALIAACENADGKYSAIILNVPSRRLTDAKVYSEAELAALAKFNANGGAIIITGSGDTNDKLADALHMAATQNTVLEALGSSLRLSDDGTYEDSSFSLSLNTYGDNALTEGLTAEDVFSYYGGSSIYVVDAEGNATSTIPATVSPVLYGNAATVSKDADSDGLGGDATVQYTWAEGDDRLLVMALDEIEGKGLIVVAGAPFMNDFDLTNANESSNYTVAENLCKLLNPTKITDIADVQAEPEEGVKFTIEGVVTSNASGYDKDTAFFDCIYVQDDTAGINAFPVAGEYQIGDLVRITGTTSSYQGERQISVTSIELISQGHTVEPTEITAQQLNDGSVLGSLVTLKGTVVSYEKANDLIQTIMVKDEEGNVGRVFIDGYITTSYDVEGLEVGGGITVTGLASYDNTFNAPEGPFPRIRIRDRADIVCTPAPAVTVDQFVDLDENAWYYEDVKYVVEEGIMVGMDETHFGPNETLTRAQIVTLLYRLAGEPEVSGTTPFTDVEEGRFYTNAVIWGYQTGLVKGMTETTFVPDLPVTREQLVTFLYRYAGGEAHSTESLARYTDGDQVSKYAKNSMSWALDEGIVKGMTTTILAPKNTATRAQAAAILARYLKQN